MQGSANFTKAIHICIYVNLKEEEFIPSSQIAESLNTNPVVVRRLVSLLRKENIMSARSGAQGGFYLSKSAKSISLWDIFVATKEKNLFLRPKVNQDCVVSSNLSGLLFDAFVAAEISLESQFNLISIDSLTNKLKEIIGKNDVSEALKGIF